jgi:hypothetical protein
MSCDGFGHGKRDIQGDGFGTVAPCHEALSKDWEDPSTGSSSRADGNGYGWSLNWSDSDAPVLCDFDFHNLRSRAINLAVRAKGV